MPFEERTVNGRVLFPSNVPREFGAASAKNVWVRGFLPVSRRCCLRFLRDHLDGSVADCASPLERIGSSIIDLVVLLTAGTA